MTPNICCFFQLYRFILSQIRSPPSYNLFPYLLILRQTPVDQVESENAWNVHKFHRLALLPWHDKTL